MNAFNFKITKTRNLSKIKEIRIEYLIYLFEVQKLKDGCFHISKRENYRGNGYTMFENKRVDSIHEVMKYFRNEKRQGLRNRMKYIKSRITCCLDLSHYRQEKLSYEYNKLNKLHKEISKAV